MRVLLTLCLIANMSIPGAAWACICPSIQPRMLMASPGSDQVAGDPILVGAEQPITPRLYDPAGQLVELELLHQGRPLSLCGGTYLLYSPQLAGIDPSGEFRLSMDDGHSSNVVAVFDMLPGDGRQNVAIAANIVLSRTEIDPDAIGPGMCEAPVLSGKTIDGVIEYSVTLSTAAPIFIEAWYDDPTVGPVRSFDSTVPILRSLAVPEVQSSVRVELPEVQGSSHCVELHLYTWTFNSVWAHRHCFEGNEQQAFLQQFEVPQWNLGDTDQTATGQPQSGAMGCAMVPRPRSPTNVGPALLLAALLRRRRGAGKLPSR